MGLWGWLHKERSKKEIAPFVIVGVSLLVSIVVVALVVAGLRVWVWEPAAQQQAGPSPSTPIAPPVTTTPVDPPAEAGTLCELDETDADISTSAPAIDSWEAPRFREIPIFEGAGPCLEFEEGFRAGFAHTMTGAVQAAFWYSDTLHIEAPDSSTEALAEYALVPGPVTDALLDRLEQVENGTWPRTDPEGASAGDFVGYRVTYSDETASVEVLVEIEGIRGTGTVNLVWADGDWRVAPISADAWYTTSMPESLSGFVLFEES